MTHPSQPEASIQRDGDVVVVEATTAEEALAAVHDQIGTGARIVGADKVRRGGLRWPRPDGSPRPHAPGPRSPVRDGHRCRTAVGSRTC